MLEINFRMYSIFMILFSIILFIVVDNGYSESVIIISLISFYILYFNSVLRNVFVFDKVRAILNFPVLFYTFSFIFFFLPYQLYLLRGEGVSGNIFIYEDFTHATNKSIVLSVLALYSFEVGYNKLNAISRRFNFDVNQKLFAIFSIIMFCLFFCLFILTNFSAIFSGVYEGSDVGSSAENGIYYLSNFFAMLISFYCIYVITNNNQRTWYFYAGFLLTCIWLTILLYSGDRNFFFLVAMVFFAGYFTFKKSLNYAVFVVVLFSAFSLYSVVEVLRKLDNKDIFIAMEETFEARDDSFLETSSITNTTITARAAIDYTNAGGSVYYGKFKIIGFAGIIPFSRSLFVSQDDYETTSSQVLTSYILGPNANWSTGTNVVSDIYLDFGVIGVFCLMYLYGRFAKFIQIQVTSSPTFEHICCYLMLLSLTSQLPRYAFDFPVRYFIWLLAVLYFFSLVNKKIRRS